ncbi:MULTISPECIES: branched-chain amino acid ABC transporter permease [Hyphomicrobiales]|jgi:branched-chain amino acid transport system permease protein|uniref:branched-chain amino acid ABC transporter permease n=1 Tax=Hyphomicrobiales TaxID=356 RepID=UPI001BCAB6FD|nr:MULTISPECIES: branched-chain amino acid ABC transporter permease [Hyphomicrobiales]CAH1654822.1 Branched-chain amino acid ABC transporter permease [Hyphomicrobiales bacterium]MBS7742737.1 branched-chain amino acid ABC transporter permease [Chelatococcus sp. HY11]MBX3491233.1 branched-chain amino acid ABC transporter permease [Parvibaculum sp.]MBX3491269.1 branched-chain amino acid ABC transporter permease [Parvibaculum sp.]MBX3542145.1 branched-chain amino acid ABC transporter permease [Che
MSAFINVVTVGLLLGGIYGLVSIGLNLIFGVIRIVNFAQGEFVMLGMYGAYLAYLLIGVDPYVSILVVVPSLFLFGVVVQRFILQPLQNEPMMQVFATFGLLLLLQNMVLAITRGMSYTVPTPLSQVHFDLGGVSLSLSRLIVLLSVCVVAIGLSWFLKHTLLGKSVRAVTQDRRSARLMGINVEWTYMLTFGTGAALAGLAGTLLAPIYTMSPQIGGNFIVAAFAVVVLGGLGSVWGAFAGGFIIGMIEAFAGYYVNPELKHVAWFLVFIIVLIVRPSGLFGVMGAEEVGLREQN